MLTLIGCRGHLAGSGGFGRGPWRVGSLGVVGSINCQTSQWTRGEGRPRVDGCPVRPVGPGLRMHRLVEYSSGPSWLVLGRELGLTPRRTRKPGTGPGARRGTTPLLSRGGGELGIQPPRWLVLTELPLQEGTAPLLLSAQVVRLFPSRAPSRPKRELSGGLPDSQHPSFRFLIL